ncbi:hypothetical protein DRN73_08140 [Candidatus Pacearchaeota archaeon]|nr:MAG: hypothetical protein DRN73_08140 [Candidatus Pacearchaeota archaeon]
MIIVEEKREYEGIYFRKPRWGTITGLRWRTRDYGRKFREVLLYVLRRGLLTERELTNLIKKWKYDIDRVWARVFNELVYYLRRKGVKIEELEYIKNIWKR